MNFKLNNIKRTLNMYINFLENRISENEGIAYKSRINSYLLPFSHYCLGQKNVFHSLEMFPLNFSGGGAHSQNLLDTIIFLFFHNVFNYFTKRNINLYSNFNHNGNITLLHYLYLQEKVFIKNFIILFSKFSFFIKSYLSLTICLYFILNHYQKYTGMVINYGKDNITR